jgi:hypothetical protein
MAPTSPSGPPGQDLRWAPPTAKIKGSGMLYKIFSFPNLFPRRAPRIKPCQPPPLCGGHDSFTPLISGFTVGLKIGNLQQPSLHKLLHNQVCISLQQPSLHKKTSFPKGNILIYNGPSLVTRLNLTSIEQRAA